ncbi:MAG: MFS transporter, partial [Burkholderiaceae bacterium]
MRSTLLPLVATLAIQALVAMATITVPVLAPAASSELNVSAGLIGLYVSLVYLGSMLSSAASGDLIRRIGAIRCSQYCLILCAVGLAVLTIGSTPALIASALVLGIGYGPITPASSHILAKTTPTHMMSFVFSVKQTGVPLGGALAGIVVPPLVLLGGWRAGAYAVAALCVLTALVSQPIRAESDADRDPTRPISARGPFRALALVATDAAVRRLALCSFFFSALQLCLTTYLVIYLTNQLGYTLVQAGLMLSVATTAGIVGRIAWGAVADRSGRPAAVLGLVGCAMAAAAGTMALSSPEWSTALMIVLCAVFGGTAIGWNGVYLAEVARAAPRGKTVEATGGALFFTFFGVLITPPLFAAIVESGGSYAMAFAVIAAPPLLCGLWLLLGAPPGNERSTS